MLCTPGQDLPTCSELWGGGESPAAPRDISPCGKGGSPLAGPGQDNSQRDPGTSSSPSKNLTLTGLGWHHLGTIVTFSGAWGDTDLPREVTQPCPARWDTEISWLGDSWQALNPLGAVGMPQGWILCRSRALVLPFPISSQVSMPWPGFLSC